MIRHTGAAGVEIGRGCLGRPWLFADLVAVLNSEEPLFSTPNLGLVADVMLDHAARLTSFYEQSEKDVIRRFRKHAGWYVAGWPVGKEIRRRLHAVESLKDLVDVTCDFDKDLTLPPEGVRVKRSHTGGPRKVSLPNFWLQDPDEHVALNADAEANVSGG